MVNPAGTDGAGAAVAAAAQVRALVAIVVTAATKNRPAPVDRHVLDHSRVAGIAAPSVSADCRSRRPERAGSGAPARGRKTYEHTSSVVLLACKRIVAGLPDLDWGDGYSRQAPGTR
jgi:hypothetical protein